jgi:hypothetical protein
VILDADRDFLFAVKDNHLALYEAVQTSFQEVAAQPPTWKPKKKTGRDPHQQALDH